MLITTIDQVREVIGNAVRKENTYDLFRPYLQQVEEGLIRNLISQAQLTALYGAPTGSTLQLRKLVERAIVWNAYVEAWYHTMYELSGTGLNRQKPEKTEALFRYQEDNIRKDILQKADEAIEVMMDFLMTNASTFSVWQDSAEYKSNFDFIIPTPQVLHNSLPEVTKSYRMYLVLRGYMKRVERNTVKGVLGTGLYAVLKEMLREGDELDANHQELLNLAADYVAPSTLLEAMPFIRVQFTVTGVRVMTTVNNLQDQVPITDEQTKGLVEILADRAHQAKVSLKKFLNATASAEVFPEYFNSSLYVAPGSREWKLPNNEGKKHLRL